MEETEEQKENRNDKPWLFKKGQSGNPGGRPKGSKTMKAYIQERFLKMTDEEKEDFLDGLSKIDMWKMGEGNPKQDTDITTNGKDIVDFAVLRNTPTEELLNKVNDN